MLKIPSYRQLPVTWLENNSNLVTHSKGNSQRITSSTSCLSENVTQRRNALILHMNTKPKWYDYIEWKKERTQTFIVFAKRNFPSWSLCDQFTASQKLRFCSPMLNYGLVYEANICKNDMISYWALFALRDYVSTQRAPYGSLTRH